MSDLPRYPDTAGKDMTQRVNELENYVINLQRYIRFALENIDDKSLTQKFKQEFVGKVSFTDLATEGSTEINGANITAGTITLNGIQSESGNDVLTMDSGGFQVVSNYQPAEDDPVQTTTYKLDDGQIKGIGAGGSVNSFVGVTPSLGNVDISGTEVHIVGDTLINGFNQKHIGAHYSNWGNYGRIINTNYTFSYYANVVMTLVSPKSVMIKMSGKMGTNYNSSSYIRYGISIPMLNSQISSWLSGLGYTLNSIAYLPKSQWLAWKFTDGTLIYGNMEYGTCFQIDTTDSILRPSRVYTTSGDVGGWGIGTWYTGGFYFDTTIFADITLA